ncbi:hypothetical protein VSVS05_03119 [Vibrio scophthalmi]|uniref:Uncharacterized protein n=1 Tax=Vibrio scophthalmi TaxID=45658 RepID=A0A1C7FEN1_9VIBR|nr:hypothetical protein VSVS05_03119 [Vibrio scophthalmi]
MLCAVMATADAKPKSNAGLGIKEIAIVAARPAVYIRQVAPFSSIICSIFFYGLLEVCNPRYSERFSLVD